MPICSMPEISVIIPVYNTENYLKEAILSICRQTLTSLEIIIVNDGSTDNSKQLIEELKQKDQRIHLINQPNSGQAVARNTGLKQAKGKYIYFMDSDDLLEPEALKSCLEKCSQQQLDFVFFDALNFGGEQWTKSFFTYDRSALIQSSKRYKGQDLLNLLIRKNQFRVPVWLYLIRHDFLKKFNLNFFPIRHEDELFSILIHLYGKRVGYIPQFYFKRRLRPNSTMTSSFSGKDVFAYMTIINKLSEVSDQQASLEINSTINKAIKRILNPVVYQSHSLNRIIKLKLVKFIFKNKYFKLLKIKSILVFLFPFLIRLKAIGKSIKKNKVTI